MKCVAVVVLLICFTLTGCGTTAEDGQSIRTHYNAITGFEAHIKVLADLKDAVQEYELDYTYCRDENDRFVITSPEALSGVSGTIAGTSSAQFSLQFDGLVLDDALPQRPGLSPSDGWYCLLCDLKNTEPAEIWTERAAGESLLALRYKDESENTSVEKLVWLKADDLRPICAELYADGARVLTIQIMDYRTEKEVIS